MKTLLVTLGGEPTPGDLLIIEYTHPIRGGVSAIKAVVRKPVDEIITDPVTGAKSIKTTKETLKSLVEQFVNDVNGMRSWLADFRAKPRGDDSFVVSCLTEVSDEVVFKAYVEGAGTETISIEVL